MKRKRCRDNFLSSKVSLAYRRDTTGIAGRIENGKRGCDSRGCWFNSFSLTIYIPLFGGCYLASVCVCVSLSRDGNEWQRWTSPRRTLGFYPSFRCCFFLFSSFLTTCRQVKEKKNFERGGARSPDGKSRSGAACRYSGQPLKRFSLFLTCLYFLFVLTKIESIFMTALANVTRPPIPIYIRCINVKLKRKDDQVDSRPSSWLFQSEWIKFALDTKLKE